MFNKGLELYDLNIFTNIQNAAHITDHMATGKNIFC